MLTRSRMFCKKLPVSPFNKNPEPIFPARGLSLNGDYPSSGPCFPAFRYKSHPGHERSKRLSEGESSL
jgi:hypothetical protein